MNNNEAQQKTLEDETNKPMKCIVDADTCPVCKGGRVTRWFYEGEVGFRDNCDTCEFEGLNITAMVLPSGALTRDY